MELKCKNCGTTLQLEDCYDVDGGLDEGYILEKRLYSCPNCQTSWSVGLNIPIPKPTEKNVCWFEES